MTTDSIITMVGSLVSVISMVVAIMQASNAKNYREQIKADIRKINLAKCTQKIDRILEICNQLPTSLNQQPRGNKVPNIVKDINNQLSHSISILSELGADKEIRENLVNAQNKLHFYEKKYTQGSIDSDDVLKIRSYIQDSISTSNTILYGIGEK
ncbi:hypothetical protein ACQKC9_03995 [Psychrobacter sp. NPDC078409]|uniref:hypothetical protein n=1 Tax=Psychrobacter sp. NPDC078409 TaxID=3390660 RepID=UPI003D0390C4